MDAVKKCDCQTKYLDTLKLAYLALTEGMEDVPSGVRSKKCATLRIEAKRALREFLSEFE